MSILKLYYCFRELNSLLGNSLEIVDVLIDIINLLGRLHDMYMYDHMWAGIVGGGQVERFQHFFSNVTVVNYHRCYQ